MTDERMQVQRRTAQERRRLRELGARGEELVRVGQLAAYEQLDPVMLAWVAEVGDFTRFRSGRQVTAYFGLAPSQRSSGDSVRLGGISGAGNALVRKLAVEGSWCYAAARHQPKLMPRDTGVPLEIRMHGRKGSERLLRRREEILQLRAERDA